jgi:hypothetical protein
MKRFLIAAASALFASVSHAQDQSTVGKSTDVFTIRDSYERLIGQRIKPRSDLACFNYGGTYRCFEYTLSAPPKFVVIAKTLTGERKERIDRRCRTIKDATTPPVRCAQRLLR